MTIMTMHDDMRAYVYDRDIDFAMTVLMYDNNRFYQYDRGKVV